MGSVSIAGSGAGEAVVGEDVQFIAASKFRGAREGFVFRSGKKGLGYYRDGVGRLEGGTKQAAAGGRVDSHRDASTSKKDNPVDGEGLMLGDTNGGDGGPGRSQQDLITMAFAGDDVESEFKEAKRAEVEAELPDIETPSLMPGWGSWSTQQREPRWMREKREKAEQARKRAAMERADARKAAVVISEKWDKKASKYKAENVPHGFSSKEVFESSMRHPLGPDYNTDLSFRNLTRPGVLKTTGVLIDPIKYSRSAGGATGGKRRDQAGPRGSKDLVKRARLRQ